jgi:hypothetical protein
MLKHPKPDGCISVKESLLLGLLWALLKFVSESVVVYAASDQGRAELDNILTTAEADGIDIPFYTSPEGTQDASSGSESFDTSLPSDQTATSSPRKIIKKVVE